MYASSSGDQMGDLTHAIWLSTHDIILHTKLCEKLVLQINLNMWLPWIDTWCTALSRPAKKNDEENDKSKKAGSNLT